MRILRPACWRAAFISCRKQVKVSEDTNVYGLQCISSDYFPVTDTSEEIIFPNGNMKDVINGWPTGGWFLPKGDRIANTFAALAEYNQRLPKPAEMAYAMNMTLGEYDFVYSRIKNEQIASPWHDPSGEVEKVHFISNGTAPGDLSSIRLDAGKSGLLRSPDFEVETGKPHFISLWVRSKVSDVLPQFYFWYDVGLEEIEVGC